MKPSFSYNIDLSAAYIMPGLQAITIDTPPEILLTNICIFFKLFVKEKFTTAFIWLQFCYFRGIPVLKMIESAFPRVYLL